MILRLGPALREDKGRLEKKKKTVPGTGSGKSPESIVIMWVFPLPEEMGKRCQEIVARWILWASSSTLLGLSLLICKMDPMAESVSPTWLL